MNYEESYKKMVECDLMREGGGMSKCIHNNQGPCPICCIEWNKRGFVDRLTPAERAVIEAAEKLDATALERCQFGSRMQDAVRALRAERAPKPRYSITNQSRDWFAVDYHCGSAGYRVAEHMNRADAQQVADMLNAAEAKK